MTKTPDVSIDPEDHRRATELFGAAGRDALLAHARPHVLQRVSRKLLGGTVQTKLTVEHIDGLAFARVCEHATTTFDGGQEITIRPVAALGLFDGVVEPFDSFARLARAIAMQKPTPTSIENVGLWFERTGLGWAPTVEWAAKKMSGEGDAPHVSTFSGVYDVSEPAPAEALAAWEPPAEGADAFTLYLHGSDGTFYRVEVRKSDGSFETTAICPGGTLVVEEYRHERDDDERDRALRDWLH